MEKKACVQRLAQAKLTVLHIDIVNVASYGAEETPGLNMLLGSALMSCMMAVHDKDLFNTSSKLNQCYRRYVLNMHL